MVLYVGFYCIKELDCIRGEVYVYCAPLQTIYILAVKKVSKVIKFDN
jgi:hypothetical protein